MWEVIVVGGGPAGLAAALTLGRSRRTTLLLDSGQYRNAPAAAVHNAVFVDGTPPADLRRIARQEIAAYPTVEVQEAAVSGVTVDRDGAAGGGFTLQLAAGETVRARRLLLATGLADDLPPIEGLAERWGRGVFHCPYCHGYEVRDQPLAVLGAGLDRQRLALHLTRFSRDVVLCTDGPANLDAGDRARLTANGVAVHEGRVARLDGDDGTLQWIVFQDGPPLARQALFVKTQLRQRSPLPIQLGCRLFDDGTVEVDDLGRTSVPGLYAAGDMARRPGMPGPAGAVAVAAAAGTIAGGIIDQDLLASDLGIPSPFPVRHLSGTPVGSPGGA